MDLSSLSGALRSSNSPEDLKVRIATAQDIPFLTSLARECYPNFNLQHAELFARRVLANPEHAALMYCGRSAGVVCIHVELWFPDRRVAVAGPMFGQASSRNPLGVYNLVREMINWSRRKSCAEFRIASEYGAHREGEDGFDVFSSIAKRLGADLTKVEYTLKLG